MDELGFKFECQFCRQRIEAPPDIYGQIIDCPKCGKAIAVPVPPSEEASFHREERTERKRVVAEEETRSCPHCGQENSVDVRKCDHCGEYMDGTAKARMVAVVGSDAEKQFLMLGGFVCLLIGIVLHARDHEVSVFAPLYLLALVLGGVSIVRKQVLGGIIVILATLIVPFALRPGGNRATQASPPERSPPPEIHQTPAPRPRPQPQPQPPPPTPTVTVVTQPEPPPPKTTPAPSGPPPADPFQTALGPTVKPEPAPPPLPATNTAVAKPEPSPSAPPPQTQMAVVAELAKDPASKPLLARLKGDIKALPDGEEKIKAMTLYGLGCFFAGKPEDGNAIRSFLTKHYPDNPTVRQLSAEQLAEPCATCQGTGQSAGPCPDCGGESKCSKCGGTGTRNLAGMDGTTKTVKCISCDGGKCKKCRGTGQIKQTCTACGGGKSRLSETKVRDRYFTMLGIPIPVAPPPPPPAATPPPPETPAPAPTPSTPREDIPAD